MVSLINAITNIFSWKMCSKPLKKHSKQKSPRKRQFLNPCGVMVYNMVDGPSKLFCNLLPYLKTKKNDLITTYAKRWTTTVHYLKLICDRRCATMSFIYFLKFWVINLDRKEFGKWKLNEKSYAHPPIMFVEDSMDSRPFVHQFAKKVFVELLLS